MTAEYPAETTIATHTNGSKPHAALEPLPAAPGRNDARRLIMPALLAVAAFVVLRRIQGGLSAS